MHIYIYVYIQELIRRTREEHEREEVGERGAVGMGRGGGEDGEAEGVAELEETGNMDA